MMIVIALLLLAVAVAAVYVVAADGTGQVAFDEFGLATEIPVWGVFVAGAVTLLVALAAVAAFRAGVRSANARRTEIRYLRQKVAHQDLDEDGTTTDRTATSRTAADDTVADDGHGHSRLPGRWRRHRTTEADADTKSEQPPAGATRS